MTSEPNPVVPSVLDYNRGPGKFIIFDGVDGSGKGTMAALTFELLKYSGIPVVSSKHPGGTLFGMALRKVLFESPGTRNIEPEALELLFTADHIHNTKHLVEPCLKAGFWVVADRSYTTTNPVYTQIPKEKQLPDNLKERYMGPKRDLLFLMDGDPAIFLERANARAETHQVAKKWNDLASALKFRTTFMNLYCWDARTVRLHSDVFTPGELLRREVVPALVKLGACIDGATLDRLAAPTTTVQ